MSLPPIRRARALEGVRVVELGRVVAAPHCGLLLAAAGADVVKVERTGGGDDTRLNPGFYPSGLSAYFVQQNWGKRSVVLDLADRRAKSAFAKLLVSADVLVENLRAGAIGRLGFGWDEVSALNPRLVMCAISGFGQTGPESRRPGYGTLAEARSGLYEMTGEPDGPPMAGPVPVADMLAASRAFGMVCAALVSRESTGRGDYVDVSLLDCTVEIQDWSLERMVTSGGESVPTRRGLRDDILVPWGQFETADGWIVLIVSADRFWPRLASLIGRPDLAADPRLASGAGRVERRAEIYDAVAAWARAIRTAEALRQLSAADVPAERVAGIAEVVADPHLAARGMLGSLPSACGLPVLGTAVSFASPSGGPARDAPRLGEHTVEVLGEVGVTTAEIEELLGAGSAEDGAGRAAEYVAEHPPAGAPAAQAGGGGAARRDDLVGRSAEFRRTLSETDLVLFAGLSGDLHPVHLDESSNAARAAGGRTIHAVFLLGLASTALARLMLREGLATRLRAFRSVEVLGAAHPGDTVSATARVERGPDGAGLIVVRFVVAGASGVLLSGSVEVEATSVSAPGPARGAAVWRR